MEKRIIVLPQEVIVALYNAGGEAKITPLFKAFKKLNKKKCADIPISKLKTAIREECLELAREVTWFQAIHIDGKRTYVFKFA